MQLDATGNAALNVLDVVTSATDNCIISDTTLSQTAFDCSDAGTPVNVDVTLTDASGNTDLETVIITVEDNIDPIITCVDNQIVTADASHTYTVQGTEFDPASTDDNCSTTIINDYNNLSILAGAIFDEGTTNVEWIITDDAGNEATCSFDVTVNVYTGFEDLSSKRVKVYPNPTTGIFTVEAKGIEIIEISNITGEKIIEIRVGNEKNNIDISSEPKGIYLIKVVTDKEILIKKLVIE